MMKIIFPATTPLQDLLARVNRLKENRDFMERERVELVSSIAEHNKKINELEERIQSNTQTTLDF
jgi:peptidoglycan hydrolase CwlO-like protein